MASSAPLAPTFYGHIASTQDGLLLFEACLSGALNHVPRRPHDRERAGLIRSGNVFIYEEHSSGIKRWTDGVPWSPSRILGNFLVYRELERPFPPGEKKRAMKRTKRSPRIPKASGPYGGSASGASSSYDASSSFESGSSSSPMRKDTERSLIGSLVDSYGFKEGGLVKKTVSVTIGGVSHHLVSYYTIADIMNNKFTTPSKDPRFQYITPRADLITKQNFRTPIDEIETMDGTDDGGAYNTSMYDQTAYETIAHRPASQPDPVSYSHNPNLYQAYGMSSDAGMYEGYASANVGQGYSTEFAPAPGMYQSPMAELRGAAGYRQVRHNTVTAAVNFSRRSPLDQYHQGDPGTSGVSSGPDDSRHAHSASYPTPSFYGGLRDATNIARSYPTQRSLPAASGYAPYDRPPAPTYATNTDGSVARENTWPVGNASSGHGHYSSSQPPWTSMGAS